MSPGNRRERKAASARARYPAGAAAGVAQPAPTLALAHGLEREGRFSEAFDAYLKLARTPHFDAIARHRFGQFLCRNAPARAHPEIDTAFSTALEQAWLRPDALVQPVARYLDAKWPGIFDRTLPAAAERFLDDPGVRRLLCDPLLLGLLKATPAATPRLETFLARSRHAALAAGAGDDLAGLLPFLDALGQRAATSGFALTLPRSAQDRAHLAREEHMVAALRERVIGSLPSPRVVDLALLACTQSLAPLAGALARNPALSGLYARHIDDPATEARLAAALVPATRFGGGTDPVRQQYEAFPYPLWVSEPTGLPAAIPKVVQRFQRKHGRYRPASVLVAGCGTGQHIITARERWPGSAIMAVDCSAASLAYAIRQTGAIGVGDVQFALADLLYIDDLGRRFDVIEAAGVLHHLASPLDGLRALGDSLAPGGVMRIALYSRMARRHLEAARKIAPSPQLRSPGELRAYRAVALAELAVPEVLYSPDFYSLGGVKDLIFHEREHSFDLPEIATMVAAAGLHFIGVEPPEAADRLPIVPPPDDLDGWHRAEQAEPLLFASMYTVWAGTAGKSAANRPR